MLVSQTPSFELPRVLLVDDDTAVLDSMAAVLADNAIVDTCPSAERALIRLQRQSFDLVVADYGLPLMNGADLLQNVFARRQDIAGVLITGSEDYYSIGRKRGYYVLLKPVDPVRLCATVVQLTLLARMKRTVQVARGSVSQKGMK